MIDYISISLLQLRYSLHLTFTTCYATILGDGFLIWLPNDYAVIFLHVFEISTYKKLLTIHKKGVTAISVLVIVT